MRSLRTAQAAGRPVSIAGGRHAMGGQQFCAGGVVLDTRPLDARSRASTPSAALIEVEAGIQWPALVDALARARRWAIAQKQTGADRPLVGGAVSANVHGRGLDVWRRSSPTSSRLVAGRRRRRARTLQPRRERRALPRSSSAATGSSASSTRRRCGSSPRRKLERVVELRACRRADARSSTSGSRDGLPLRRLPVRDRPASDDFLAARRLLLLPAGRRRHADRRRAQRELSTDDWQQAPLPRAHRQGARLRALRDALPGDVAASSTGPTGTSSPTTSTATTRARRGSGRRRDGDDQRDLRARGRARRLHGRGRATTCARYDGGRRLRHRPPDRARRRDASSRGRASRGRASSSTSTSSTRRRARALRRRLPPPDRPRARARRQLLPHLPPLGDARAARGRLSAASPSSCAEARARSRGALPERLVPLAP